MTHRRACPTRDALFCRRYWDGEGVGGFGLGVRCVRLQGRRWRARGGGGGALGAVQDGFRARLCTAGLGMGVWRSVGSRGGVCPATRDTRAGGGRVCRAHPCPHRVLQVFALHSTDARPWQKLSKAIPPSRRWMSAVCWCMTGEWWGMRVLLWT